MQTYALLVESPTHSSQKTTLARRRNIPVLLASYVLDSVAAKGMLAHGDYLVADSTLAPSVFGRTAKILAADTDCLTQERPASPSISISDFKVRHCTTVPPFFQKTQGTSVFPPLFQLVDQDYPLEEAPPFPAEHAEVAQFTILFNSRNGHCVCLEVHVAEADNGARTARLYRQYANVRNLRHSRQEFVQLTFTVSEAVKLLRLYCHQLQTQDGYDRVQVTHPRGLGSPLLERLCRATDPVLSPSLSALVAAVYDAAYAEVSFNCPSLLASTKTAKKTKSDYLLASRF